MSSGAGIEQGVMAVAADNNIKTAIIFKNRDTYQGETNKTTASLLQYKFDIDFPGASAEGDIIYQIIANATHSGSPTYADIDTNDSIIEYDHTTSTGSSVTYSSGGQVMLQGKIQYFFDTSGGAQAVSSNIPQEITE